MSKNTWLSAAEQFKRSEVERQAELEKEREKTAKQAETQKQQEQAIQAAATELENWMGTDEYKAALRLLGSIPPFSGVRNKIHLAEIESEGGASWSATYDDGRPSETRQCQKKCSEDFFLTKEGFESIYHDWIATYHGDFQPSSNEHPASPEEVVRAITTAHDKKPEDVLTFIREHLDEIAQKASQASK